MARTARTVGKVLILTFVSLLALSLALYVFRDPIASELAALALERKPGMRCTPPELQIDASLDRVTVSPIECSMAKGPISAFSTLSDLEVQLDGLKASRARVARAIVDQRDREVTEVESNTLGDLAKLAGMRDMLVKGMLDASEGFSPGGPVMQCGTLTMKRDGKLEAVMRDFQRTYEHGWERTRAAVVEGGPEFASIRDLDMSVTRSRGKLKMDVFLGKPERGESPDVRLKVEGDRLNQSEPHFDMSL
jgi:hypothetical protein